MLSIKKERKRTFETQCTCMGKFIRKTLKHKVKYHISSVVECTAIMKWQSAGLEFSGISVQYAGFFKSYNLVCIKSIYFLK